MAQLHSALHANTESFTHNREVQQVRVDKLRERILASTGGGRPELVERHRKRGKLLMRERIDLLIDPSVGAVQRQCPYT